ncbi:metal-dependent transcriptional regulator [Lacticaseibacillus pabuli]|uniref:Manganese transport regulator n=1 Tax=Lacticaseibacillus pabuli TaxID=3025672 RepID=A0ABY7WTB4_9LACO|nr:metal-dependent transcriptional regulator [Lacticaseibacillus sp. KACC 23028]WDF83382.1 metal-dependent transcriptional regulator [Lacticaseibacillus sp. KACC 23028]
MTPNEEDYLKIIMELGGDVHKVSNKQIVASLSVSAASVSEMVSKMVAQKLVTHTRYQGIQLTKTGMKQAARLVRNHRLWEVFLMKQLLYPYDALHAVAEGLEHATTDDLARRLDYLLDHPKYCPHGGVIPDEEGNFERRELTKLSDLVVGDKGQVARVIDEPSLLDYLGVLDVKIDDALFVLSKTSTLLTARNSRNRKVITIQTVNAANVFMEGITHTTNLD